MDKDEFVAAELERQHLQRLEDIARGYDHEPILPRMMGKDFVKFFNEPEGANPLEGQDPPDIEPEDPSHFEPVEVDTSAPF